MWAMDRWPALDYVAWRDTGATLQLWSQIAGKVSVALAPWLNHGWHVALHVNAHGYGTGPVPSGEGVVEIDFDFVEHRVVLRSSERPDRGFALQPMSVAAFHRRLFDELAAMGVAVRISPLPNEVADPIPFAEDETHRTYDAVAAHAFWRALLQVDRVFRRFRTSFLGKASPVHLWWGSFDHAVTRFSGRAAPPHPGGIPGLPDAVTREAYSHEVSSAGFWPGSAAWPEAAFYSYAYPSPAGFDTARIEPSEARWVPTLGEWILPYEAVRRAADPEATLLRFLETTYRAAADLGRWDRGLDCSVGEPGKPRAVAPGSAR